MPSHEPSALTRITQLSSCLAWYVQCQLLFVKVSVLDSVPGPTSLQVVQKATIKRPSESFSVANEIRSMVSKPILPLLVGK